MISFRLAWRLWQLRPWQALRVSLLSAVLVLSALATHTWLDQQWHQLEKEKHQLTVSLIIEPAGVNNMQALATDLRSLAPELIERVEVVSDSAVVGQLQARHGVSLSDLLGDSVVPSILRIVFMPAALNLSSLTAFIEQCRAIPEITDIIYPLERSTRIFEKEQQLRATSTVLSVIWGAIALLAQWLHSRSTLPLSRRDGQTLLLLGSTPAMIRRIRASYALLSHGVGLAIAAVVVWGVLMLLSPVQNPSFAALVGVSAAGIVVTSGIIISTVVEPR
ncbi:MAG: hypothetical protein N2663_00185 [Chlorobi bacterium]|nr:hypothetical protein [Chlorobiota bacterium]